LRALVLQHDVDAPPGLLAEWAAARGWTLEVARLDAGADGADPAGFDRLVTLGSEHAADDDAIAWQADERRLLAAAIEAEVPIVGICFGGQSLARALGGGVGRAARPEIGWVEVGTAAPELIPDGPWFEWHLDEILPPADAEILARNPSGVQAFRSGAHVGLQFHPEVDEAIVGTWAELTTDPRAPADLVESTAREAPAARERAFALFDALLG
jgi:GMP synthase-like glutamine amidotransferase